MVFQICKFSNLFDIFCDERYVEEIHEIGMKMLKLVKYKTQFGYDVEYYNEEGNFEYGYGVLGTSVEDAFCWL